MQLKKNGLMTEKFKDEVSYILRNIEPLKC